jgi:UDP-N-acetyl-D-glucosamine dehydrogenase
MSHTADLVDELYRSRRATIGIVGLGYVGMPLALAAWTAGFRILGYDSDNAKVEAINAGRSYIKHISSAEVAAAVRDKRLRATSKFAELGEANAVIICVPTPLTAHREPDLSYVADTARAMAPHLRKGQLIVLESTTWPGTTVEVVKPLLEQSGLKSGEDFYLAFSPEREDPGNPNFSTKSIPKIVGGDDPVALRLASSMYGAIVAGIIPVSSTQVAEAVKLTENIFRAVNIALVNELKMVYGAMGIDVWEVIEAAKSKPFGYMPFYPGPGLGGHCIPIDPFYLTWKAREFDISTRFIELAGEINTSMPRYVIDKVAQALNTHSGRGLRGARILIVGVAYKKNVEDIRESPAFKLMELIEARGATTEFYDPNVDEIPRTRGHPELAGRRSIKWDERALRDYDLVLIATDHDGVDYAALASNAKLIVDTRNACARAGATNSNIIKA